MSINTAKVVVNNDARFPIVELAIKHYQKDGDYTEPKVWTYYAYAEQVDDIIFDKKTDYDKNISTPLVINFKDKFTFDSDHDDYWIVCWRNMHDPCMYYLVKDLSFWQKFERDAIKDIDDIIGASIDLVTDSIAGTIGSLAVNHFVDQIFAMKAGDSTIENKIDTDVNIFNVNLPCNRQDYKLQSGDDHKTDCSAQTYMPGTDNSCYQHDPND